MGMSILRQGRAFLHGSSRLREGCLRCVIVPLGVGRFLTYCSSQTKGQRTVFHCKGSPRFSNR